MLGMLLAYDAAGNVIATLDFVVSRDSNGNPDGLIDFEAHERSGGPLLDVWNVEGAAGSGVWPEWLGSAVYDFRVERSDGRIVRLVHKVSGVVRDRAVIEAEVQRRLVEGEGRADLRDLVGGPTRPVLLDRDGRNRPRAPVEPTRLPRAGQG